MKIRGKRKRHSMFHHIDIVWNDVNNLVDTIEDLLVLGGDNDKIASYRGFKQEQSRLHSTYNRILQGANDRDELIAYQCNPRVNITLRKHEEYHRITEQVIDDLKNFFSTYKTFLNQLALLISLLIPQSKIRGLRISSFGKLAESSSKTQTSDPFIAEIMHILSTKGQEVDKKYTEYRDKYIEHPSNIQEKQLSVEANGKIYLHQQRKIKDTEKGTRKSMFIILKKGIYVIKLMLEGKTRSGRYYTVYLHLHSDIPNGVQVKKGQKLGEIFDNTVDHFKKYGEHIHVFGSPTAQFELGSPFGLETNDFIRSPDPTKAMIDLGLLLKYLLNPLSKYLEQTIQSKANPGNKLCL